MSCLSWKCEGLGIFGQFVHWKFFYEIFTPMETKLDIAGIDKLKENCNMFWIGVSSIGR